MDHVAVLPVPPTPSSKKREKSVIMCDILKFQQQDAGFCLLPHQNNNVGPNTSVIQIDFA